MVAEKYGPETDFEAPINHNMKWHRKWFYIRAEARKTQKEGKDGFQISLSLDDAPLLTFFDANPLPGLLNGGRVAFWTVDGTLMIARAKIESRFPGPKTLPAGLLDAVGLNDSAGRETPARPVVPLMINGVPSSIVAPQGSSWKVTNPVAGGAFGVVLNRAPLTITPSSNLHLDLKLPPEAKVDLYAVMGDDKYLVELDGKQRADAMTPSLGAASWGSSGGQTVMSFGLGEALAKRFPDQKSWKIDQVIVGALHGDAYRWVGFDGNPVGVSYQVGNLDLTN